MAILAPEVFVARVFEKFGGRQAVEDAIKQEFAEFDQAWNQDTDRIGRVLRAHLAVEHFVGVFLAAKNPGLGALDKARLSYAQKLELLDPKDRIVEAILPGLRLLGAIRNRVAHRLRVELTDQDKNAFLKIEAFRAMRDALQERGPTVESGVDGTLVVLEEFARFGAGVLHSAARPDSLWALIYEADATEESQESVR